MKRRKVVKATSLKRSRRISAEQATKAVSSSLIAKTDHRHDLFIDCRRRFFRAAIWFLGDFDGRRRQPAIDCRLIHE